MNIRKKLCYLSLILAVLSCSSPAKTDKKTMPKGVVMAYYVAEKDYRPETLPLEKLTHIIFSFTEVLDGEMKFKHEGSSEKLHQLVAQKETHPHLKVMIACGGWGGCEGFSAMAETKESRKKFVDSTIEFVEEYQLDGVDIDWEYPGLPGAGNPHGPQDTPNFTFLMKELREAMDATGKELILTFASAGWERYYDHIETLEVMKYVDFMNIMTYDFVGGSTPVTAHHTNLGWIKWEDLEGTAMMDMIKKYQERMKDKAIKWNPRSAEYIIDYCLKLGVKPEQIVIGAAFYGRAWKGVPPENKGLYQPNKGVHTGWSAYRNIRENYENKNGFVRYWDSVAKAPYLYSETDSIFISYDDTASVKLKVRYAIENNLGGIMFWQLGNDTREENSLLDAIYEEATK